MVGRFLRISNPLLLEHVWHADGEMLGSDGHESNYDWDFIQHYVKEDKRDRSVTQEYVLISNPKKIELTLPKPALLGRGNSLQPTHRLLQRSDEL